MIKRRSDEAEPLVGIDSTTTTAALPNGVSASSSSSGFILAGRLGHRFGQSFWMAGEYLMGSGSDDTASKTKYTKSTMGLLFGRDLSKHNLWAGYGVTDTLIYQTTPELTITGYNFQAGYGYGYGYEITTRLLLNIGIIVPKYSKVKAGANEADLTQFYSSFNVSSLILSLSLPFGDTK